MKIEEVQNIICPNCSTANPPLRPNCKICGLRLVEIQAIRQRITQLEQSADTFLEQQAYYDAFRALSILLEYKPGLPKYLKELCKILLKLGARQEAEIIFQEIEKKMKHDPELGLIRQELGLPHNDF